MLDVEDIALKEISIWNAATTVYMCSPNQHLWVTKYKAELSFSGILFIHSDVKCGQLV
jgi:hypothetical protein